MTHFETNFPVRYYETDQMGIVHHSNYIRYFECARNAMMAAWGYPIEQCEADGVTIPIVSVSCRYHRPAKMGDVLRITAEIEKVPLAKLTVVQKVYNASGDLLVSGEVVLGFLNKDTGFPVRCPDTLVKIIEEHLGSEQ